MYLHVTYCLPSPVRPLHVETKFAWYILKSPAKVYKDLFVEFYRPHRVAQIAVSVALEGALTTYVEFEETFLGRRDELLDDVVQWEHVPDAVSLRAISPFSPSRPAV